jgi:hypothetical protein
MLECCASGALYTDKKSESLCYDEVLQPRRGLHPIPFASDDKEKGFWRFLVYPSVPVNSSINVLTETILSTREAFVPTVYSASSSSELYPAELKSPLQMQK